MTTIPLLLTMLLIGAGGNGDEPDAADLIAAPSPTPTCAPSPSPTPRMIPIELYFRRAAKIVPVHREEGEFVMQTGIFEIVQEVPWLTGDDLIWVTSELEALPPFLRLHLSPAGKLKYREAMMGNVGRTIIFTIDGTSRYTAEMTPIREKDHIDFYGDFSMAEAEKIVEQVNNRPASTPTPAPIPTPAEKKRFIIK